MPLGEYTVPGIFWLKAFGSQLSDVRVVSLCIQLHPGWVLACVLARATEQHAVRSPERDLTLIVFQPALAGISLAVSFPGSHALRSWQTFFWPGGVGPEGSNRVQPPAIRAFFRPRPTVTCR